LRGRYKVVAVLSEPGADERRDSAPERWFANHKNAYSRNAPMFDSRLRPYLAQYVEPLVRVCAALRIHPNVITLIGAALATISAASIVAGRPVLALATWFASRLADALDGECARRTKRTSDLGARLDVVADFYAYNVFIAALAIASPSLWWRCVVIMILYGLCMGTALVVGAIEARNGIRSDERGLSLAAGLAEAAETNVACVVFLLWPGWLANTLLVWIGILILTVLGRLARLRDILPGAT